MESNETSPADLAALIRSELADAAPQGLTFNDHVVRQDASLERVAERLRDQAAPAVGQAVGEAIAVEVDGWTVLKLVELVDRLELLDAAPALIALIEARAKAEDERSRFIAGRAAEVLLKLPLALDARTRANAISQAPLEEIARFRMSEKRARSMHRPRQLEWALLVILMAIGLAGVAFVFSAK